MPIAGAGRSRPCRVFTQVLSANRAMLGSSALNLRLTRSSTDPRLAARFSPEGRLAHARDAAPSALAHDARHAPHRRAYAHAPQRGERLGCAVYAAHFASAPGDQSGELPVAHRVRARRPALPCAVAPAGRPERGAHLRDRPPAFVEENELELRPLQPLVLALEPTQVRGHLERVVARPQSAASAFLTQSDRPRRRSPARAPPPRRSSRTFCKARQPSA